MKKESKKQRRTKPRIIMTKDSEEELSRRKYNFLPIDIQYTLRINRVFDTKTFAFARVFTQEYDGQYLLADWQFVYSRTRPFGIARTKKEANQRIYERAKELVSPKRMYTLEDRTQSAA